MKVHLETPRLVLREFTIDDAALLHQLDSDPEVMRHINGGVPVTLDATINETLPRFLEVTGRRAGFGYWAALEKPTLQFIGWLLFRPATENPDDYSEIEIGYRLTKRAWGKGYASEGSLALLNKGFHELGVPRVFAIALPENDRSIRVMDRLGMSYEATVTLPTGETVVRYVMDKAQLEAVSSGPSK